MRPVIELIKRVLIGLRTERKDFDCLSELQRDVVQAYMRYILKTECITKIFDRDPRFGRVHVQRGGLSRPLEAKGRDSEEGDVSSPQKSSTRSTCSRTRSTSRSTRESTSSARKSTTRSSRCTSNANRSGSLAAKPPYKSITCSFSSKKASLRSGLSPLSASRQRTGKKPSPEDLKFLKKILYTLRSDKLMDVYRRKITRHG